jgi:hypothetical protein
MLDHASLTVGGRSPRCFLALRLRTSLSSFSAEYKAPSPMQSQARTVMKADISSSSRRCPRVRTFPAKHTRCPARKETAAWCPTCHCPMVLSPSHDYYGTGLHW